MKGGIYKNDQLFWTALRKGDNQALADIFDNMLYFKKAGIEQFVQKLEDWYGVEISLEGNTGRVKARNWTYTGMFKNQNLENVLTGISYVKDFSFEDKWKNIKLMFN